MKNFLSKNKLQTIFSQLNPRVPAGSTNSTLQRIHRDENIVNDLLIQLRADEQAKVLLSGHIGVGKSTELIYLAEQMEEERFIVQCSISQVLGVVHTLDIFSLLIIILQALIEAWQVKLQSFPKGLIERLVKYHIKAIWGGNSEILPLFRFPENDLDIKTEKQLLNFYSKILKEIPLQTQQLRLKALPYANITEKSCNFILSSLTDSVKKPILVIIDDLDKIRDESSQGEIFLDYANTWSKLPCNIVATVPLEIIYSSRGRQVDDFWGEITVLNPLPIPEQSQNNDDMYQSMYYNQYDRFSEKCDFYRQLLMSVDALSSFEHRESYLKLANISGGLPRSFVNACLGSIRNAMKAGEELMIRDIHIEAYEIQHLNKWRGRIDDEDYEALLTVLVSGGSNLNNPKALHLLRDGILLKDENAFEDRQIRLASWAKPLVEAYCKRKGKQYPNITNL